MHAKTLSRGQPNFTVKENNGTRVLHAILDPEPGREAVEIPLGRYFGKMRVIAEKNSLFSNTRRSVDESAAKEGVSLMFHIESMTELPGGRVSMRILLYEPMKQNALEFQAFKPD